MRLSLFACVLGASLLSGCAQYSVVKSAIKVTAAKAADELLDDAIFIKCRGATVGAVRRRYAGRMEVWEAECLGAGE